MPQSQLLSSIVPLGAIERPACPKCHAQMMLARIVPAFLVRVRTGAARGGADHQARDPVNPRRRSIRARWSAAPP
jgi:hypothetical protein